MTLEQMEAIAADLGPRVTDLEQQVADLRKKRVAPSFGATNNFYVTEKGNIASLETESFVAAGNLAFATPAEKAVENWNATHADLAVIQFSLGKEAIVNIAALVEVAPGVWPAAYKIKSNIRHNGVKIPVWHTAGAPGVVKNLEILHEAVGGVSNFLCGTCIDAKEGGFAQLGYGILDQAASNEEKWEPALFSGWPLQLLLPEGEHEISVHAEGEASGANFEASVTLLCRRLSVSF